MKRRALITGIAGQVGSLLSEFRGGAWARLRSMLTRGTRRLQERHRLADSWFWDHYEVAPRQIEEFLAPALRLEGLRVADLGCGDGIMALGVAHLLEPARVVGFDVNPVDTAALLRRAREAGVGDTLPANVEFRQSQPERLPSEDGIFDVVYTWSAFEHVGDAESLLREVRRVLVPHGVLFLQLWPFYFSARGSHLWEWFPEEFHHLLSSEAQITRQMRSSGRHAADWTEYMAREFATLNKITADRLGEALVAAGLSVRKLQLMSEATNVPAGLDSYPLSRLGVSGVKLLAVPV